MAAALPRRDGVVALDETRDLSASIEGRQLSWKAPEGDWHVVVMTEDLIYEATHAAISLAYKKPCIDLLTPEPTARFLEVTHDRYAEKLGQDLGRFFVSTFTDEPSLQSYWFRPMPYRVFALVLEYRERVPTASRPGIASAAACTGRQCRAGRRSRSL